MLPNRDDIRKIFSDEAFRDAARKYAAEGKEHLFIACLGKDGKIHTGKAVECDNPAESQSPLGYLDSEDEAYEALMTSCVDFADCERVYNGPSLRNAKAAVLVKARSNEIDARELAVLRQIENMPAEPSRVRGITLYDLAQLNEIKFISANGMLAKIQKNMASNETADVLFYGQIMSPLRDPTALITAGIAANEIGLNLGIPVAEEKCLYCRERGQYDFGARRIIFDTEANALLEALLE